MASNLDRSLDEILATRPRGAGRRGGKPAAAAVVGGVRKRSSRVAAQKANASIVTPTNPTTTRAKGIPTGPSGKVSASKIIVSNLPFDVSEQMIKEYFQSVVGPIRRATLTYGPTGQSRGVATVEFHKSEHATLAAQKYNGVEVDSRPMKVELVVDPNAPASFADRVGAPNKIAAARPRADARPKTTPKPVVSTARGRGTARGNKTAGARGGVGRAGSGRSKPKTAEQLDQEMADYFGGNETASAAPVAVVNGGDGMDDDAVLSETSSTNKTLAPSPIRTASGPATLWGIVS
ncbi:putative mRNA export protein mlo3 [Tricharina praecox]|uniref:putative mRNA export protein mlo3 n=1 Tax=Tricharina praecox TaxID=43433 RepID=UPI00222026BE|nr:putative mRNA export protein mlo3 [Tricharina praecox]KAI5858046.1 putative mRNA export protein mlo3 [Tricharina praecox]